MEIGRSGDESLHEERLITFARGRHEVILQDWIRLASERGILLHAPSIVLRRILEITPRPPEDPDDETVLLEPAKLAVALGFLRRCVLERWRLEVGRDLGVSELGGLDDAVDSAVIEAYARARTETQRPALAREDVLAVVAHDLRNPLSTIILAASAVARASDDSQAGAKVRRQSEIILRSARQMDRFVSDLLDLSKPRENGLLAVTKTSCDGAGLARDAVEVLAPVAAARRLELVLDVAGERFPLSCDPDRVGQILSNLIGNAAKFTPEQGRILVAVRHTGDDIVFSVTDNGIGISPEQLPHIFEPYFQGYKGRAGLGLGLTVTRSLVRAHGGRIWVESVEGKGSTFFVALPGEPGTQRAVPEKSSQPLRPGRDEEELH